MGFRVSLVLLLIAALPAIASAQHRPYGAPRSSSIIRPAGLWEDYMHVPDGHCGCPMPVRCNNYAHCCNHCGIRPVCWLKRFGRMLDCLLPCDCCHGGLLGCGGCGCCGSYGGFDYAPGCSSCAAPGLTDPFQDDPMPPTPTPAPEAGRDVRNYPMRKLPQSIARDPRPSSQARTLPPESAGRDRYVDPSASIFPAPPIAARPALLSKASQKSVLRRTSLEEEVSEPAELAVEVDEVKPISKAPIVRNDDYGAGVPENPLRAAR